MENATKALLITGGALIAIIIISLFISMFSNIKSMEQTQDKKIEMQQIAAFNAEYEAFDKKVMYGADVITLANKIENNNNSYSANNIIKLYVNEEEIKNGHELENSDDHFKTSMFKCDSIHYNKNGRVDSIYISTYKEM